MRHKLLKSLPKSELQLQQEENTYLDELKRSGALAEEQLEAELVARRGGRLAEEQRLEAEQAGAARLEAELVAKAEAERLAKQRLEAERLAKPKQRGSKRIWWPKPKRSVWRKSSAWRPSV